MAINPAQHNLLRRRPRGGSNGHTSGQTTLVTAATHAALVGELAALTHRARTEIAERLRDARTYGDDSNNDEFHALQEERMVLEARIALLENTLARAVIVDPDEAATGVATIGSTVTLEDLATGKRSRYRVAGAHAARGRDAVSAASPMGQALLGAAPGDEVTFELPSGKQPTVRLIATETPPP